MKIKIKFESGARYGYPLLASTRFGEYDQYVCVFGQTHEEVQSKLIAKVKEVQGFKPYQKEVEI